MLKTNVIVLQLIIQIIVFSYENYVYADSYESFSKAYEDFSKAESDYDSATDQREAAYDRFTMAESAMAYEKHQWMLKRTPLAISSYVSRPFAPSDYIQASINGRLRVMQGLHFLSAVLDGTLGMVDPGKNYSISAAAELTIPIGPIVLRVDKSLFGTGQTVDSRDIKYDFSKDFYSISFSILGCPWFEGIQYKNITLEEIRTNDSNALPADQLEFSTEKQKVSELALVFNVYSLTWK